MREHWRPHENTKVLEVHKQVEELNFGLPQLIYSGLFDYKYKQSPTMELWTLNVLIDVDLICYLRQESDWIFGKEKNSITAEQALYFQFIKYLDNRW